MDPKHFVLLYVQDTPASARFYERLLGRPPVESSPTFAMFPLAEGLMLGLWARAGVEPAPQAAPGASELCMALSSDGEVDALHARWRELGVQVAQSPTRMDFGYTALALDPDGHRLRAFCPAG
ncbi:VOC family protein [Ramlibacter ginsenosidimutans]|uniref:VOC family protein n=1 Tax=Ramlibacter ginsenosidimutans TaxID=502333 RepID=A0A934TVH1_9BURK|nr:VOC family protein [Ramlibacter ginsenosidimutans]MBK6008055.1 VOC family protein [Ramlibacter ginsenosidimutans]